MVPESVTLGDVTVDALEEEMERSEAEIWVDKYFVDDQPIGYRLAKKVTAELLAWTRQFPDRRSVTHRVIAMLGDTQPMKEILITLMNEAGRYVPHGS